MNPSEHLTENQLNDYLGNSALDKNEKQRTGRHLLQCDICLKRLPQPTPQQFWAALMTDNNYDDDSPDEKTTLAAWLDSISDSLKQPKILVWGAASALTICLFFTAFFWFDAAKSSYAEKEVARNFEVIETQSVPNLNGGNNQNLPPTFPKSVDGGDNSPPSQNVESKLPISGNIKSDNRSSAQNISGQNLPVATNAQPKAISKTTPRKSDISDAALTNVSSTRGGASLPKCSELLPLDLATGISNEAVLLKWKKVPKAAKYHIYVSDDEEILVDEFETEQETTYALKKPLAPQKTYHWKVVVTLEDGKTIIGDSQKFTVKDLQSNQKKSDGKEKSLIRCSESKLNR